VKAALIVVLALARAALAAPPSDVALPCKADFAAPTPTGDVLLVACDGNVRLLELATGKERGRWPVSRTSQGAISADGSTFALSDRATVRLIRVRDGKPIGQIALPGLYLLVLQLSPDGKLVLAAPMGSAPSVWTVAAKPKQVATLATEFGSASAAAWTTDGSRLAVASDDTAIRVYDTTTWKHVFELRDRELATLVLAWSTDDKRLALGAAGGVITIVDGTTGKTLRALPAHGDHVTDLSFVADALYAVHREQGKPKPERLIWSAEGWPTEITDARAVSGRAVVAGALWLTTVAGDRVQIWSP
jgi:WD40 repeat protein